MAKNANIRAAIQSVRGELDTLNNEIANLQAQRAKAATAPVTREAAKARSRDCIGAAACDGRDEIARAARTVGQPGKTWDPADALDTWLHARDSFKLNRSLIVALMADQYIAAIDQAIDADSSYDAGLTDEQRQRRLADLDAQIADAEQRRNTLEQELVEAGLLPDDDAEEHIDGDRGMVAFREQYERDRQKANKELAAAGVMKKSESRVIRAFDKDDRITVGVNQ